jgi:hypothetical protein
MGLDVSTSIARLFFIFALCFPAASFSYEVTYRKICRLVKQADFSGRYRIRLAAEYCDGKDCVATKYRGTPVDGGGDISFVSVANLQAGSEYFVFFSRPKFRSFFLPGSGQRSYPLPKGVNYFVEHDAVFQVVYPDMYYRDLPVRCFGGGEGCEVMLALPDGMENKIESAKVLVPEFEGIKRQCSVGG